MSYKQQVFKYFRQGATWAKDGFGAQLPATTTTLPPADVWQGLADNASQLTSAQPAPIPAAKLDHTGARRDAPAPSSSLAGGSSLLRSGSNVPAAGLRAPLGMLKVAAPGSPSHVPPLKRYIDQLRAGLLPDQPGPLQPPQQPVQLRMPILAGPLGTDMSSSLFGAQGTSLNVPTTLQDLLYTVEAANSARLAAEAAEGSEAHQGAYPHGLPRPPPPPPPRGRPHPAERRTLLDQHSHHHGHHHPGQQAGGHQAGVKKARASSVSVQLNKEIMAANSTSDLLLLVRNKGHHMDFFNISSAISRTPKLMGISAATDSGAADSAAAGQQQLHLDSDDRALVDCLAQLMCDKIHCFDARGLANSAWAFGKMRYVPTASLPSLIASEAAAKMDSFGAQNLSNLAWAFVYMHHRDERVLKLMADKVRHKLDEFKPQELANVLWAFASLEFHDEAMLVAATQRAAQIAPHFKEQELSNALWAMGRLGYYDRQVFGALLAEARVKLHHFLPQGISNVAWAMSAVHHYDENMLRMMVAQCMPNLSAFDVQALSNLVSALAGLGHYDSPFMDCVLAEALSRLDRFSPLNLANILWAYATLGHHDTRMLHAWAKQLSSRLSLLEGQALSNTAWSFAKLGHHDPTLFAAMASALTSKVDTLQGQALAQAAWAFAVSGTCCPALMDELALHAMRGLADSLSAEQCAMTLWAYATSRHHSPELFHALMSRLHSDAARLDSQSLSNALWAHASMGYTLGPDALSLAARAVELMPHMSQQELCRTAWALAAMNMMDGDAFACFSSCLGKVGSLTRESLHQALLTQLLVQANQQEQSGAVAQLPASVQQAALQVWNDEYLADPRMVRTRQEIGAALEMVGAPNMVAWAAEDGIVKIDVALECGGKPVAVLLVGNEGFASNESGVTLGEVAARRKLLEARGWSVVNVSQAQWEALGDAALPLMQRGALLLTKISEYAAAQAASMLQEQQAAPAAAEEYEVMADAAGAWQLGPAEDAPEARSAVAWPGWTPAPAPLDVEPVTRQANPASSAGASPPASSESSRTSYSNILAAAEGPWGKVYGLTPVDSVLGGEADMALGGLWYTGDASSVSYQARRASSCGSMSGDEDSASRWLPRELCDIMGFQTEQQQQQHDCAGAAGQQALVRR